jgi:hypothetical protein
LYIDLSSEEIFEENYDKLLRNIYQVPLFKKPSLGKPPMPGLARSTYYYWLKAFQRPDKYAQIKPLIEEVFHGIEDVTVIDASH